jgi:hypothetical protein
MYTLPRRIVAITAASAIYCFAGAVQAEEPDIAALEARIATLEAMVSKLMSERSASVAQRQDAAVAEPTRAVMQSSYKFGGYMKLDAMFSDYSDGDLSPGSLGSQFYVPATIPVGGSGSEGPDIDMQGRESRINFRSDHPLADGKRLGTFVEFDFFLGSGGNERVSNSYNPRLRHAFVTYDKWLAGQTWSTFQDAGALPENLDFIGPAEGTTFVRQAQLRYTNGPWEIALENPETTITPFGGGDRIVTDDGGLPDFVARYTAALDNGYIKAAGLVRELNCETDLVDDAETAFGLSLSGKHNVGRDDFRWMATAGKGTGRYLGLNTSDGAVLDGNNKLNAIEQWGGFVSYRHFWNDRWRSNVTISYLGNDNDTALTGSGVTRDVYSAHLNLLYQPLEKMTVGGELLYAERELESGVSGDMRRLLISAKYAF